MSDTSELFPDFPDKYQFSITDVLFFSKEKKEIALRVEILKSKAAIVNINLISMTIVSLTLVSNKAKNFKLAMKNVYFGENSKIYKIPIENNGSDSQSVSSFMEIMINLPEYSKINEQVVLAKIKKNSLYDLNLSETKLFLCSGQKLYQYWLTKKNFKKKMEGHKSDIKNFIIDDNKRFLYR